MIETNEIELNEIVGIHGRDKLDIVYNRVVRRREGSLNSGCDAR